MKRINSDYIEAQLLRFKEHKNHLLKDDDNYANHEEKRTDLLKYYNFRITSYEIQLTKINTQRKNDSTTKEATQVQTHGKQCS